jgi:hypothetical protein
MLYKHAFDRLGIGMYIWWLKIPSPILCKFIIIINNKNNNNALSFTKDKDISRSQKNFLNEGRTQ